MAWSLDSVVADLLENEDTLKVLKDFLPDLAGSSQIEVVSGMKLRKVLNFPQANMSPEKKEQIDKALQALN